MQLGKTSSIQKIEKVVNLNEKSLEKNSEKENAEKKKLSNNVDEHFVRNC